MTAPQTGFWIEAVTPELVANYLLEDPVLALLNDDRLSGAEDLVMDRWLRESPGKRYVTWRLYSDLLSTVSRRVHDIGAGLSSLTAILANRHRYVVTDLGAHHDAVTVRRLRQSCPALVLNERDWAADVDENPQIVIANDLFPNVDQRLAEFLTRYAGRCEELRVSLTYYEAPRYYTAKRVNGDEILTVQAWNGQRTWAAVSAVLGAAAEPYRVLFAEPRASVFPNGRQVLLMWIRSEPGRIGA